MGGGDTIMTTNRKVPTSRITSHLQETTSTTAVQAQQLLLFSLPPYKEGKKTRKAKLTSILDYTICSGSEGSTWDQSLNDYSLEDLRRDMKTDKVPSSTRPSLESLFIAHHKVKANNEVTNE
jgi:hypothetical protein